MTAKPAMRGNRRLLGAAVFPMLMAASVASAAITYQVDQTIGLGSVVGTITTDGNTGTLGASDITAWNLNLNGVGATLNLTNLNSGVFVTGGDVSATTHDLYFNFSGTPGDYLLFQVSFGDGYQYYCDAVSYTVCYEGATVTPQYVLDASEQNMPESGNQIIGVAGTPEPAAWALMLLGFCGLGAALRSRRTAAAA